MLRRPLESARYLAIRYTERLEDAGALGSVGSKGDSFDNALAETVNGLYKAELIDRAGPWRSVEQVESETAAWVHWWNSQRLHGACVHVRLPEFAEDPVSQLSVGIRGQMQEHVSHPRLSCFRSAGSRT